MQGRPEEPIVFNCGAAHLIAIVHRSAAGRPRAGVLVVVGGPQYRVGSHRQFTLMARSLAGSGFAVLRFDHRGMGDSGGEPRSFEQLEADIHAALDLFLAKVPSLESVFIWGLCDAASAILLMACRDRRIKGLILANPWVRTTTGEARALLRHYYLQRFLQVSFWRKLLSRESAGVRAAADFVRNYFKARKRNEQHAEQSFVDRMRSGLESFDGPVLFLISQNDLTAREFVDLTHESAAWRKAMAREAITMVTLDEADHTFSTRASLDLATRHCAQWLTRVAALRP